MKAELNEKEWEYLDYLLIRVADMPRPTWQEKREVMERNLSPSGYTAMQEISMWGWEP